MYGILLSLTDTYPPTQSLAHSKVYNITMISLLSFSDIAAILNDRKKKLTVPCLVIRKSAFLSDIFNMLLEEVLKILSLKINFSGNLLDVNIFTVAISLVSFIKPAMNVLFQD